MASKNLRKLTNSSHGGISMLVLIWQSLGYADKDLVRSSQIRQQTTQFAKMACWQKSRRSKQKDMLWKIVVKINRLLIDMCTFEWINGLSVSFQWASTSHTFIIPQISIYAWLDPSQPLANFDLHAWFDLFQLLYLIGEHQYSCLIWPILAIVYFWQASLFVLDLPITYLIGKLQSSCPKWPIPSTPSSWLTSTLQYLDAHADRFHPCLTTWLEETTLRHLNGQFGQFLIQHPNAWPGTFCLHHLAVWPCWFLQ